MAEWHLNFHCCSSVPSQLGLWLDMLKWLRSQEGKETRAAGRIFGSKDMSSSRGWSLHWWGENSRQGNTLAASTLYKDRVDHMCRSDNDTSNVSATCISYWGGFLIQISPLFSTPVNLISPLAPQARLLPTWWKENGPLKQFIINFYSIHLI